MFKKLKNLFSSTEKSNSSISEKDQFTARGEPYIRVLDVNFDSNNPGDGYFELEWNSIFVKKLLDSGYQGSTEEEIVDQWFTQLCRGIGEEMV
jgi:hypothetical protein